LQKKIRVLRRKEAYRKKSKIFFWLTENGSLKIEFFLMKYQIAAMYTVKSTYFINSIIYEILQEFAANQDDINEETYMHELREFIEHYCLQNISEEDALDILNETYSDLKEDNQTPHQLLQIILMNRLL
jgi:hypothetical protein